MRIDKTLTVKQNKNKNQIKKIKRKKKKRLGNDDDDERQKLAQQLQAKYGRISKRENDVQLAHLDKKTFKIVNPTSYDRLIKRAVDAHLNRLLQPEQPKNLIQTVWICSLCQNRSYYDSLGELYGPYYVSQSEFTIQLPEIFLANEQSSNLVVIKKENSKKIETENEPLFNQNLLKFDVWLHGNCALWAPDLQLIGGRFLSLAKNLSKYWKQKCKICLKIGASIPIYKCNSEYVHYHCAVKNCYRLNTYILRCELPL